MEEPNSTLEVFRFESHRALTQHHRYLRTIELNAHPACTFPRVGEVPEGSGHRFLHILQCDSPGSTIGRILPQSPATDRIRPSVAERPMALPPVRQVARSGYVE